MGEFSISHILIVVFILLIFFGPSRLPALGQSLGRAIKGFKDGMTEAQNEINRPATPPPTEAPAPSSEMAKSEDELLKQNSNPKIHQNNS